MAIGVQGDLWQMGVALPIKNRSFREGKVRSFELASGAIVGDTSLTLTPPSEPVALCNFIRQGDVFVLGPSTSTGNAGATETVVVTVDETDPTVTAYDVQSISGSGGLVYSYESGDPVVGVGTALAGGWEMPSARTGVLGGGSLARGILGAAVSGYGLTRGGYDDDYFGQYWKHYYGSSPTATSSSLVQEMVGARTPIWGGKYRIGCAYKYGPASASGASLGLKLSLGSTSTSVSDYTLALTSGSTPVTSWTRAEGVVDASSVNDVSDYVAISQVATVSGGTLDCWIDHVWAEHAIGVNSTDNGYVTLSSYPVQGSLGFSERKTRSKWESIDNRIGYNFTSDSDGLFRKWEVECEFGNASKSMWDTLKDLERWQDRGYFLTLHTFIDDLPWVLVGYMSLGKVRYSALNRHYFSFQFSEA